MKDLIISSPKRDARSLGGWEGFFPYYAGYPARFAMNVLSSIGLPPRSVVLDPWNGSGTTTYSAAQLGHSAIGIDLNPVMVVIARARMLSPNEADSLIPLCSEVLRLAHASKVDDEDEPLRNWFHPATASYLRAIERSIQRHLVGTRTRTNLDHISSIAATFYAVLFSVCRDLTRPFRSSNPTWVRLPRPTDPVVSLDRKTISALMSGKVRAMSDALAKEADSGVFDLNLAACRVGDSTQLPLQRGSIDLVLSSPPYCTRIDYAASTRVELAIMTGLTSADMKNLGLQMVGSTRVPSRPPTPMETWGSTCLTFLENVKRHQSKASNGYYHLTHLDYFDKVDRSINCISEVLRPNGKAILVVQDSYYKEVHNDLPSVFAEMACNRGLSILRQENFASRRTMAHINQASRTYGRRPGAVESVLCFQKNA